MPEDNVPRFRSQLSGMRYQWRDGTIVHGDFDPRILARIAHADQADLWRLRRAIFKGGQFEHRRG